MAHSKRFRLNPQVQPDLTGNRAPVDAAMQFSNSLSYDRLSTPDGTGTVPKSQPQVQVRSDGAASNGLAETGFSHDIEPKQPSKSSRENISTEYC